MFNKTEMIRMRLGLNNRWGPREGPGFTFNSPIVFSGEPVTSNSMGKLNDWYISMIQKYFGEPSEDEERLNKRRRRK